MNVIQNGSRILFQGDSITNCFRRPEEINNAYQLGSGYPLLVASRELASRPSARLTFLNRGVSGDSLASMAARWEEDAIALKPDVVSILIGVGTTLQRFQFGEPTDDLDASVAEFAQVYRDVLSKTLKLLPNVRFVICEPFLLVTGTVLAAMRKDIERRAAMLQRIANDTDAIFVPLQQQFDEAALTTGPEYWAYDGVHPTAAGHWLIAEAWLKATG